LERRTGPFEAVAGGEGGGRNPFHRRQCLAGAVAGLGRAVDERRTEAVIANESLWPEHEPRLSERPDRHHRSGTAAHVDAIDVLYCIAEWRLGLDIHLPGAAEKVEVVDIEPDECRLQRVEDVIDLDAQN